MAVEDRSLSEFPRALQVAEQALVMISNPDGLGGYDTNGAVLTEVGKAILGVQYTQQLGNVSVFDAIKNCRVLSGTTTPLANEGANGQLYVKNQTVSNVDTVIGMYFKKDGAWLEISLGGGGGSSTLAGLSDVDLTSPTDGQLLRYNGTSGKWENAGIINDTTASASSVYSSNKTDTLLSEKQNATDNSLTTTNKQIVPAINELNYLSDIKRIEVEVDNQSCGAGQMIVVNYSVSVPTGYKVIGAFDQSYWSGVMGAPIIVTDAGNVSFNYFTTGGFSNRKLKAMVILAKNVNR